MEMTEADNCTDNRMQYTDIQRDFIEHFIMTNDPYQAAIKSGYNEAYAKKLAASFNQVSKLMSAIEDMKRVEAEVMGTWQPVAAIAERAGVSVRETLNILVRLYNRGSVKMSYSRIDGHNKVHMFKKIETQRILGVVVQVESEVVEL